MVYKLFDKKSSGANASNCAIKCRILPNQRPSHLTTRQLAYKLHRSMIRKFEKGKE